MLAEPECIACILSKQENKCRGKDKKERFKFLTDVLHVLYKYGSLESSPQLCERIDFIYDKYFGLPSFRKINHKYNSLLLNRYDDIKKIVNNSEDNVIAALKYACAGNYIDFRALDSISNARLNDILNNALNIKLDEREIIIFKQDILKADSLVYLTDNCGEIVLDRILLETLLQYKPDLEITVIVRGGETANDATMKDAYEVGLADSFNCVGSGSSMSGIVFEILNSDLKEKLNKADIIISKGQGNFESMFGCKLNVYYLFLCKCDLFTQRFKVNKFNPIFANEKRLSI